MRGQQEYSKETDFPYIYHTRNSIILLSDFEIFTFFLLGIAFLTISLKRKRFNLYVI